MSDPLLTELFAFVQVIVIDLLLAGDNVIVICLVAAGLPDEERRRAIVLGIVIALLSRIGFSIVAVQLLDIVGLLFAGGLLLLWVTWKLWRELHTGGGVAAAASAAVPDRPSVPQPGKRFSTAVLQIAVADISMSLDNVLAVAGAARENMVALVVGLVLSVALMGSAAALIVRFMHSVRWLQYLGVAIVMIYEGGGDLLAMMATP